MSLDDTVQKESPAVEQRSLPSYLLETIPGPGVIGLCDFGGRRII